MAEQLPPPQPANAAPGFGTYVMNGLRTFGHDARDVWRSSRAEMAGNDPFTVLGKLAMLGANVVGIGAEQVIVNETILGMMAGNTLENNKDILTGALATAASTGATAFFIQAGLGTATALSLKLFPQTMGTIRGKLNRNRKDDLLAASESDAAETALAPPPKRSLLARGGTAFTFGTSLVTIGRNAKHELTTGQNIRDILGDAAMVGGSVAGIAGFLALGANSLRDTQAEWVGDLTTDVMTSPLTYLAIFAGIQGRRYYKKRKAAKALPPTENLNQQ